MAVARRRAIPFSAYRVGVALLGAIDGANTVFSAPEPFVHNSDLSLSLFWNGVRLVEIDDYTVTAGVAGSGVAVTLLSPPKSPDKLRADYIVF